MDNTEAEFEVGQTIPVRQTTTNQGVTNESFQNQEAKLSLQITPQINKVTRFVKLKINQSIALIISEINNLRFHKLIIFYVRIIQEKTQS